MIIMSTSLNRRLAKEIERAAGSLGRLIYYDGVMPQTTDAQADGVRIAAENLPPGFGLEIVYGNEPKLPKDARYWRLLSNEGDVVMQGDGS